MGDISGVNRIEFDLGRGQTAVLQKEGKSRKNKSHKDATGEDEFHLNVDPIDDTVESLYRDHVDLEV
jgi:hypothetical protein